MKIFISHYGKECKLARKLKKHLEKEANIHNVFVGEESINRGVKWFNEIRDKIEQCDAFIVIASPASVNRRWVAFECGAAQASSTETKIVLVHSGLDKEGLPDYLKDWDYLDLAKEQNIYQAILSELKVTETENKSENNSKTIVEEVENLNKKKNPSKLQDYLPFKLKRDNDNNISFCCTNNISVTPPNDIGQHGVDLSAMHGFLANEKADVITGVAIGVQNVLWYTGKDKTMPKYFVGVRRKSTIDPTSSNLTLSMGHFNTGYMLLRKNVHTERIQSIESSQDLFKPISPIKYLLKNTGKSNELFDTIKNRLNLFGSDLYKIKLGEEECYASILVNNSTWYPRYEIGIWKYIEIDDKKLEDLEHGPIDGFGEDLFQDYRGKYGADSEEINYWIWVNSGEIYFRSYPEERFIKREQPTGSRHHQHSVLVSSDVLEKQYGVTNRYTPFVNDEVLENNKDSIIRTQFSLPARRLLTWL